MARIKMIMSKRLEMIIERDPVAAEGQIADNNQIAALIKTSTMIKIFKLALIIFNVAYFVGFFWYCFCEITTMSYFWRKGWAEKEGLDKKWIDQPNFLSNFGLVSFKT